MTDIETIVLDEKLCDIDKNGTIRLKNPIENKCNVIVPEKINGIVVKEIANSAFIKSIGICSIRLPDSIESIKGYAFRGCIKLKDINIPQNLTDINNSIFYNTEWLKNKQAENPLVIVNDILIDATTVSGDVIIPDGVKDIAPWTFENNNITSVKIPESISKISSCAFAHCLCLESVYLPNTIKSIEDSAFSYCYVLKSINLHNNIEYIGSRAFSNCKVLTDIVIPNKIAQIKSGTFEFCINLKSISIPKSVKTIEDSAFYNCLNLSNILGMENVKTIDKYAFCHCSSLENIPTLNNLKKVEMQAFYGTKWLNKRKNRKIFATINNSLVNACKMSDNIVLPNNIENISSDCFYDNKKITSIEVNNKCEDIDLSTFFISKSLKTLILPNTIKSIDISSCIEPYEIEKIIFKGSDEQFNSLTRESVRNYIDMNDIKVISVKIIDNFIKNKNVDIKTFENYIIDNPCIEEYALSEIDKEINSAIDLNEKLRLLSARDKITNSEFIYSNNEIESER